MIKFINIIFFLLLISFNSGKAVADVKPDCSMHSTKTWTGLMDKINCKKGLKVNERKPVKKWKDLNPLKKKLKKGEVVKEIKVTNCDDYSTKTWTGLMKKIKCKREKK
jgi:hypothetical protein|tara:strand:- start:255 stop:578 length:324 start_codon:yes stop_codon:yes gene_type:complete